MASYKEIVEMLGENLASLLELAKKWLIWNVDIKTMLHIFQNISKSNFVGLIQGTHEIKAKEQNNLPEWIEFYKKNFNIRLDLKALIIPSRRAGFDRLIIIAKGLTLNQIFQACSNQFPCWRYIDDLDKNIINNRTLKDTYAIWVRNNVEADEEYKNLSANEFIQRQLKGITLLERLVLELKYFTETGGHLDITNITLCAGSRFSVGRVPCVDWGGGEFCVGWCSTGHSDDNLRCREVVTL